MSCIAENYWNFFHRWSKWGEEHRSDITRTNVSTGKVLNIGILIVQKRTCTQCGLVERKTERITV